MILLNFLRMAVDTAFYGAFAGYIAGRNGGSGAILAAIVQCVCFGLSTLGGQKRLLRLLLLLPMAGSFLLCRENTADCILLIPTTLYILWLVWKNDYVLNYERQSRLFDVFGKALLPFSVLLLIVSQMTGRTIVTDITLPYGVIMLASSILLMRTLRHDSRVYLQWRYQLVNISLVGLLMAVVAFLSSDLFLNGCKAVIAFVYRVLLAPVLGVLMDGIEWLIWLIYQVCILLADDSEALILPEIFQAQAEAPLPPPPAPEPDDVQQNLLLTILFWGLVITAACVALVWLFRWMNQRIETQTAPEEESEIEEAAPKGLFRARPATPKREASDIHRIRGTYKSLLKWRAKRGFRPKPDHTSLDVHRHISTEGSCEDASAELRQLYIRARYAGQADEQGAKRAKKLYAQIRQQIKDADNVQ